MESCSPDFLLIDNQRTQGGNKMKATIKNQIRDSRVKVPEKQLDILYSIIVLFVAVPRGHVRWQLRLLGTS